MIKHLKYLTLFMLFLPLWGWGQTYLQVGNTLQRSINPGMDTNFRFNLGSPGFMYFYTKPQVDAIVATGGGNGILSGLVTTIIAGSPSHSSTTAGSYRINGVTYSSALTNITLEAQDATLFRQDILYATTSGTVLKSVGVLGPSFTAPDIPDNTIPIANIFISPTSVTVGPVISGFVNLTTNQSFGGVKTALNQLKLNHGLRFVSLPSAPVSNIGTLVLNSDGTVALGTSGGGTTTNTLTLAYGFVGQPLSFNGSTAITAKLDSTLIRALPKYIDLDAWMGQSLFQGKGDTSKSPKLTPNIAIQWNYGVFRTANDPIGPLADTLWQGTPIPAYNIQMYKMTGVQQCDVSGALGATSQTSAANTGNGTWDVSTPGNLTQRLRGRIDSCKAALIAQGFTIRKINIHYELSENDAIAYQSSLITGATWYTAFTSGVDSLRSWYGKNMNMYVSAIGTRSSATSYGFDTIRNREYQAALAGYCIIVDNNLQNFPTWGLMNPKGVYVNLHPSQEGNNQWGYNMAIGVATAIPQITKVPASLAIPSFVIPTSATLTTNPSNGAFEHYEGQPFFSDGPLNTATRYRIPLIPQNGICPTCVPFGASNRGFTTDSVGITYNDANNVLQLGMTATNPYGGTGGLWMQEANNSSDVRVKYGSNPITYLNWSADGTSTSPTAKTSGQELAYFGGGGYGASQFSTNMLSKIDFIAGNRTYTNTDMAAAIAFYTTPYNSVTAAMRGAFLPGGGLALATSPSAITTQAQLYVRPITNMSFGIAIDGPSTIPLQTWRSSVDTTKNGTLTVSTALAALDFSVPLNINFTNNQNVKVGSGTVTLSGLGTGVVHSSSVGLLSSSTIATADIASNAVTYAKMQAMTANRLLGSGLSGTAVAEVTLGTGLSFTGTTLNATGGGVTTVTSTGTRENPTISGTTLNIPNMFGGVWQKFGTVLNPDNPADQWAVLEPTVIYEGSPQLLTNTTGSVFKMWFTSFTSIWYAESLDGLSWTRATSAAIANHDRSCVLKVGSTYILYALNNSTGSIDRYTSTDGVTFTLANSAVITKGTSGQWNASNIANSSVYYDGTTYQMLLDGNQNGGTSPYTLGYYHSTDGITWTQYGSNPVLGTSTFEAGAPYLTKVGSTWYCWFLGGTTGTLSNLPTDLYFSSSTNLTTWTTPVLISSRTMADEGFGTSTGQEADPTLVEANGKTYLFYSACPNGGATFTPTNPLHIKVLIANYTLANLVGTTQGDGGQINVAQPYVYSQSQSDLRYIQNAYNTSNNTAWTVGSIMTTADASGEGWRLRDPSTTTDQTIITPRIISLNRSGVSNTITGGSSNITISGWGNINFANGSGSGSSSLGNFDNAGDFTATANISVTSGYFANNTNGFGATLTRGLYMANTSNASSGTPVRYSTQAEFWGTAYNGSASTYQAMNILVKPINSASPSAKLSFGYNNNLAGFVEVASLGSTGIFALPNSSGQVALVAGTKAVTVTGVTTSSKAFVTLVTPSGTSLTTQYQAVCTANTITIQANVAAGTINVSDVSTLNYFVIN